MTEDVVMEQPDPVVAPVVASPRIEGEVDVDGFDGYFARHHSEIVTALSLALSDDHLGRDAAAEGFARALQRWPKVSRYDNPAGWIYRVGLNWARSRRRKTRREAPESAGRNHEGSTDLLVVDPQIQVAIDRLSSEHRAVVVARFHLDWSEQQIATALDIRPGTVKSRLSRALERLAADLAGY